MSPARVWEMNRGSTNAFYLHHHRQCHVECGGSSIPQSHDLTYTSLFRQLTSLEGWTYCATNVGVPGDTDVQDCKCDKISLLLWETPLKLNSPLVEELRDPGAVLTVWFRDAFPTLCRRSVYGPAKWVEAFERGGPCLDAESTPEPSRSPY